MAWIKRNLYFVIGGLVALGMLGWAGFYNFTRWQLNAAVRDQLNAKYEELQRVSRIKPNPGNKDVDNIKIAREQQQEVYDTIARAGGRFARIPSIPPGTNVSSQEFAAALRETVDQMQRDALAASILFPPRYNFSFEAQRGRVLFSPGSLDALAMQLGEVKTICGIINRAKVNTLNSIRRERVSADDASGPATDYTSHASQTNDLAVLTPYEVTFQCFSPELAAVLAGFAGSSNGIIVKNLNVESAALAPPGTENASPEAAAPVRSTSTALNEKQLRITLLLEVVKLLPRK